MKKLLLLSIGVAMLFGCASMSSYAPKPAAPKAEKPKTEGKIKGDLKDQTEDLKNELEKNK